MTNEEYLKKTDAFPRGTDAYDDADSPWREPHVLLNKTFIPAPCGCEVDGYGTLQKPVFIRFCKLHREAMTPKQQRPNPLIDYLSRLEQEFDARDWSRYDEDHAALVRAADRQYMDKVRAAIREGRRTIDWGS